MNILLVEDDAGLVRLITKNLEKLGFSVISVTSGAAALAYLKKQTPDIMLLDYSLPDINGKELLETLNSQQVPTPPFIITTGNGDEHIAVHMMKLGAMDYVVKDILFLDKLPNVLKRVIKEIESDGKLKQTEIELKTANQNLENLNIHQNAVREKERKAISREIHDELGQSLSALKIDMCWIIDHLEGEKDIKEKLEGMINITNNTITTVQRISSDLRPGLLDDLGLVPASEWYCQEFVKRTGISCEFNGSDINFSNEHIDIALYRILQEGLTNILRHAKATKSSVELTQTNSNIILKISDNGIGLDMKQLNSNESLGFIGIKERIKALNGNLQVLSTKSRGTELIVNIPIK